MQKLLMTLLFLSLCTGLWSQVRDTEMKDKIESRRIAMISSALDLSPEEAQTFWPLYNSYKDELEGLKGKYAGSENDLDKILELEQDKLDLKKDFAKKIEKEIGSERTVKLFKANRRFQENMLKGLRQRSDQRRKKGF